MSMDETDIKEITDLLSIERLGAINKERGFENSVIDASVIDLHQESLSLSGDLMSIVAVIEIALRNAVYQNLNDYFKANKRLFQSPKPFEWLESEERKIINASNFAKRAKYNKLHEYQKIKFKEQAYVPEGTSYHDSLVIICDPISVSDGDIIAQLTFSFWKKMYAARYKKTLWNKTLNKTFPNEKLIRKSITKNLEIILKTRDRLAHHEPIWLGTFNKTISSIKFIAQKLNQPGQNSNSLLAKLLANDIKKIQTKADAFYAKISPKPARP